MQKTRKMVLSALFSALMAVCAWVTLPLPPISFTMQTFGVYLALFVLGGKWGSISIATYLTLGVIGLPVFSLFQSGAGALLGATGGFLWGFFAAGLVFWLLEKWSKVLAVALSMLTCYAAGCIWYSIYAGNVGIFAAVTTCVLPYLVPDVLKISLAHACSRRIKRQRGFATIMDE